MRRHISLVAMVVCLALGSSGCSAARMVQVGPDGGVVAIPQNTNSWPYYHRDKALALIQQKCPEGYEIVSEEEVVTGQTAHTNSNTNTNQAPALVLGGGSGKTSQRDGTTRSSDAFGGFAIPLGDTQQQTVETTSYTNVTEWRISYRRK